MCLYYYLRYKIPSNPFRQGRLTNKDSYYSRLTYKKTQYIESDLLSDYLLLTKLCFSDSLSPTNFVSVYVFVCVYAIDLSSIRSMKLQHLFKFHGLGTWVGTPTQILKQERTRQSTFFHYLNIWFPSVFKKFPFKIKENKKY